MSASISSTLPTSGTKAGEEAIHRSPLMGSDCVQSSPIVAILQGVKRT